MNGMGKGLREDGIHDPGVRGSVAVHAKDRSFQSDGVQQSDPETENMYFKSINTTVDQYRAHLEEVRAGSLQLTNMDLDSGNQTVGSRVHAH